MLWCLLFFCQTKSTQSNLESGRIQSCFKEKEKAVPEIKLMKLFIFKDYKTKALKQNNFFNLNHILCYP